MTMAPEEGKNPEEQSLESRKNTHGNRKKTFILGGTLIAIIIVMIGVIMGIGSQSQRANSANRSQASIATPTPKKPDLELLSDEVTGDDYCSYITGEVKNNTAKEYIYAEIRFTLYDKSDVQIGTATDNVSNLKAGDVWKYKVLVTEEKATQYKFKELTGF